jgi:hypothetical protein
MHLGLVEDWRVGGLLDSFYSPQQQEKQRRNRENKTQSKHQQRKYGNNVDIDQCTYQSCMSPQRNHIAHTPFHKTPASPHIV